MSNTKRPGFLSALPSAPNVRALHQVGVETRREYHQAQPDNGPQLSPAQLELEQELRGEMKERVSTAIEKLETAASRLAELARSDALELAFYIAKRAVESELRINPEPLFALARSALQRVGDSRHIVLRVSPDDQAAIESARDAGTLGTFHMATVKVVADGTLGPGDCIVETDFGAIDGRLNTRFEELRRAVDAAEQETA